MEKNQGNKVEINKEHNIGMIAALSCAIIWGLLPIYWKSLKPIDSMAIICYRMVLVAITTFVVNIFYAGHKKMLEPLKNKRLVATLFLSGSIIGLNWSIYIWAVNANYVIQTSIGYYIEPLVVAMMGILIFKETLNKYKLVAIIMASIGVFVIIIHFGEIPFVALGLASTFAIYAGLKKTMNMNALLALFYETVLVTPFAIAGILYFESQGRGIIGVASMQQIGLLMLAGILTATPLALFGIATNRVSLIEMGLTEYISPSLSLILGIFVFFEPFDSVQFYSFVFIWLGLLYFTYGEIRETRK